MPLDPISVGITMRTFMTANALIGTSSTQLSTALANGLSVYGKTGMAVGTVDVGTAGTGKGIGAGVVLAPPVLTSSFTASFASNGILGIASPQLINALALGYSQALALAVISTVHPSVGSGTGQLLISVNTPVAVKTFIDAFVSATLVGPMAASLATAVAVGLDQALPSARGTVAIAGPSGTSPSTGFGSGKLL